MTFCTFGTLVHAFGGVLHNVIHRICEMGIFIVAHKREGGGGGRMYPSHRDRVDLFVSTR